MLSIIYLTGAFLALVLIALVAGNNISSCTGAVISSRIVSKRNGIALAAVGYALGLILQGSNLHLGVLALAPGVGESAVLAALLSSTLVFIASHFKKALQPLSIVFAGSLLGAAIGSGITPNAGFLLLLALFWIIAPAISLFVTLLISRGKQKKEEKHVWRSLAELRLLLIVISFITAYTLGANTFGFVYSAIGGHSIYLLGLFIVAAVAGSFLFSSGQLQTIGNKIMALRYRNAMNTQLVSSVIVEIATLLGVPLSNTQAFAASVFGSSLSYKERLLGVRTMRYILSSWIISLIASFVMGYGFTVLMLHFGL